MVQEAEGTSQNPPPGNRQKMTAIRVNVVAIAVLIALLNGGLMYLAYVAITSEEISQFVAGALVGLLPVGITALAALGTTLLTDK